MKKKIISTLIVAATLLTLVGCGNKQILDTKWTFTNATIVVGDKAIEVEVDSWRDYKDDTTIQITAKDGTVYLTDIKNVLMVGGNK